MSRKVLDVGQCDADHFRISEMLNRDFDVEIQRAHTMDEAIKAALDTPFDLILINRIIDLDGSPGIAILHDLKNRPSTAETPVMIVSDFANAQDESVSAGGKRGFGKSELASATTTASLAEILS